MSAITSRYEFVYLFDVVNGNPNGDPDAGNLPRLDPETSCGLVTDVCLKRKVRNYVEVAKDNKPPHEIYVKEKAVLTRQQGKAYEHLKLEGKSAENVSRAKEWMCKNFFDVRTFGAVMSLKENNCGQVRGPVQFSFSRSIDPIVPLDISITRMAVATESEADKQFGDNRTMGRKSIVPYGLYRCHGFISAPLAEQTGFTDDDLNLFWDALRTMFDHDHSAARGEMAARKLFAFKHDCKLGNAPAHKCFEAVEVARCNGNDTPPRDFSDYAVTLHTDRVPEKVEVLELL